MKGKLYNTEVPFPDRTYNAYEAFIQQYRIGYVLFAQVIHTVSLYCVVKMWRKIGKLVNNTDYLLLTGAFPFCNLMTVSIEAAIFGYPQKDLYMILGADLRGHMKKTLIYYKHEYADLALKLRDN